MPSSDAITIPTVMKIVRHLKPNSILDIGCGNGKYGFLFREALDLDYGRMQKGLWNIVINGVEVENSYITSVHEYIYNVVFISDWKDFESKTKYDIAFMGDVLEHFTDWEYALNKARAIADTVIVVAPNWKGSIAQGAWFGNKHEAHRVELSPGLIGGKCLFANSKCFISVFGDERIEDKLLTY